MKVSCNHREAAIRRLVNCTVLAMLLCLTGIAGAQQVSVVGSLPYGAAYVSNGWLPVRVDVRNDGDRELSGTVRVVPIAENVPEYRMPVRLAPKSRLYRTMWAYFPHQTSNLIARVTLNDDSGAQLSRVEMTGAPAPQEPQYLANGIYEHGFLLSITGEEASVPDEAALDLLGDVLENSLELQSNVVQLDATSAPTSWVPYASVHVVQLRNLDPDALAPEGRNALMDYVRAGGVLLIDAPDVKLVGGSWLEPLLPVRLVGNREIKAAPTVTGGEPLSFGKYLHSAEAVDGGGRVLVRDGQFVHAAYRNYGLGRIVFSSFMAGALPAADSRTGELWRELLGFTRHPVGTAGSLAQNQFAQLMEPMLGRKAASWGIAAAAVVGLVLLVVVAHVLWRGPRRPSAFKVSLAASVLIAAGFSLMAAMRQEAEPLQEARLTIVDASPEGSFSNQYAAVSGSQQSVDRASKAYATAVRPEKIRQDRPVLSEWPTVLQRVDVYPQRVDLVSLASTVHKDLKASASGRFGPDGLEVSLDNSLNVPLTSAQLGWGIYRLSLPGVPVGESRAVVNSGNLRPVDEYTSASGLASQDEQHKGTILRSLLTSQVTTQARGAWPTVYGWAGQWPEIAPLAAVQPDRIGSQTLVRIPVRLERSEGRVRIDGMFNELYMALARGIPYDAARREFIQTALPGEWLIGVDYPREVGLLRPSKARLTVDLATPQHAVEVRLGQCPGGKQPTGRGNPNGRLIAEWNQGVGMRTAEFECTAEDFDANGRVWLRLGVKASSSPGSMGVEPQWHFGQLMIDLEGDVTQGSEKP